MTVGVDGGGGGFRWSFVSSGRRFSRRFRNFLITKTMNANNAAMTMNADVVVMKRPILFQCVDATQRLFGVVIGASRSGGIE